MKILTFLFILMFCGNAYADIYVAIKNDEPMGVVRVKDEHLADWKKDYVMEEVNETYAGKQHYEIKYNGVKVRFATQEEIDEHLEEKEKKQKEKKEKDALKILKLEQKHIDKLKELTP